MFRIPLAIRENRLSGRVANRPWPVPTMTFDSAVELTGFEPVTSWLQTRRSNQLSYSPADSSLSVWAEPNS